MSRRSNVSWCHFRLESRLDSLPTMDCSGSGGRGLPNQALQGTAAIVDSLPRREVTAVAAAAEPERSATGARHADAEDEIATARDFVIRLGWPVVLEPEDVRQCRQSRFNALFGGKSTAWLWSELGRQRSVPPGRFFPWKINLLFGCHFDQELETAAGPVKDAKRKSPACLLLTT